MPQQCYAIRVHVWQLSNESYRLANLFVLVLQNPLLRHFEGKCKVFGCVVDVLSGIFDAVAEMATAKRRENDVTHGAGEEVHDRTGFSALLIVAVIVHNGRSALNESGWRTRSIEPPAQRAPVV